LWGHVRRPPRKLEEKKKRHHGQHGVKRRGAGAWGGQCIAVTGNNSRAGGILPRSRQCEKKKRDPNRKIAGVAKNQNSLKHIRDAGGKKNNQDRMWGEKGGYVRKWAQQF